MDGASMATIDIGPTSYLLRWTNQVQMRRGDFIQLVCIYLSLDKGIPKCNGEHIPGYDLRRETYPTILGYYLRRKTYPTNLGYDLRRKTYPQRGTDPWIRFKAGNISNHPWIRFEAGNISTMIVKAPQEPLSLLLDTRIRILILT